MAITTLAAVALGAGALGNAALGAGASNKAAKAAKNAAADSTAVQREQLAAAQTALSPYSQAGIPASQALNSFLGLTPTTTQTIQPNSQTQFAPDALSQFRGDGQIYEGFDGPGRFLSPQEPGVFGMNGGPPPFYPQGTPFNPNAPAPQGVNGRDAFKAFLDNSDYGFQFQEGGNAVNSGYAGAGTLQSGSAMKALEKFRQNLQSGYRGEFLNALGNQQGVGVTAGSALAGVGQNFANSITGINSNKADAIGNAALTNSRNVSNIFGGITSAVGYGLGR